MRLLGKHSQHGLIDDVFADAACLDLRDEWGSIRVDAGQFNVHTGTEGEHGRLPARRGDAVQLFEEGNAEVVGNNCAGKPPLVAQDFGQQPVAGRGRDPIHV